MAILAEFCQRWKISKLELFGSMLTDPSNAKDVDLLVTFSGEANWGLFDHQRMETELAELLAATSISSAVEPSNPAKTSSGEAQFSPAPCPSMSPNSGTDAATLSDVVKACERVMDYTRNPTRRDLDLNHLLVSACCYQIAVIGEAVKRLSPELRANHPDIPWKDIAGMRDRLIHGYDSVDFDELWKTASEDIPILLEQIKSMQV
ncbi:MAG: HepT-like ribonuclease domain-containing protein [Acidobacteriota bacterium]